jgi:hypothetical protein
MNENHTYPRPLPHPSYDGAPVCRLCQADEAGTGHEWCPAVAALVCEGCCRRLMSGEYEQLATVHLDNGDMMSLEVLYLACAICDRAPRRLAERILQDATPQGLPC